MISGCQGIDNYNTGKPVIHMNHLRTSARQEQESLVSDEIQGNESCREKV